jgi:hypothetical protein
LFSLIKSLPLVVLLTFLALSFAAISGWGIAFSAALGRSGSRTVGIGEFWLGYLLSLIVVEFLNLWIPIDWRFSLVFYLAGIVFIIHSQLPQRRLLWDRMQQFSRSAWMTWILRAVSLYFVVLSCCWAMAVPINEDSWAYHFQSIRWINEYPIVPGLGNLHGRLAFNQSHFGFLALLNFFPYWNKGYAAGGLLLFLAAAYTAFSVMRRDIPYNKLLFVLLLIVIEPMAKYSASPSPDFAVSLMQIVGAIYLLYVLQPATSDSHRKKADFLVVICMGAALCSLKLSGLVFALALVSAVLWDSWSAASKNKKVLLRVVATFLAFGFLHLLRGMITSGVPLYPSTLGSFWHFDWSVPIDRIRNEAGWIYSCARTGSPCQDPVLVMQDWSWLDSWWHSRVPDNAKTVFFVSLAATGVTACANFHGGKAARPLLVRDVFLMCPFFCALVFWFFSAPDVRFLGRLLELMFALSIWSMVCSLDRLSRSAGVEWIPRFSFTRNIPLRLDFTAFLVCLVVIFCVRLFPVPRLTWPTLPEATTSLVTSVSGVAVYVPSDGTCWFNMLPCAPSADPSLQYRVPLGDDPLAHGFRVITSP